ncbi:hypothetical protein AXW37_12360 [Yersinia ruckeri]|jgi:hypothetical protein|nr:hypothetical protein QMA0440_02528 [Yersinia ruckeri]OIX43520.1 hypothetical protein AXW22_12230 [Yersinia ruckeri]OJC57067.1 hypothetical protein AXW37_12360 [Yersinia ruckeri]OJC84596.1 hypothetical protein AXW45_12540 [Yersinia ruckeri]
MRFMKTNTNRFSRVLEPVKIRFVSPDFVVNLNQDQMDNIERIEFSPPKIGDSDFGKFKVTYITPQLCEVSR